MMMSFCKKAHSLLGPHAITDIEQNLSSCLNGNNIKSSSSSILHSGGGGLGLMSATIDICNQPNVLESSTLKSTPQSSSPSQLSYNDASNSSFGKKDPGGIGFIDDIGWRVGGLMSCTESLGCESSNERRVDDIEIDQLSLGEELETASRRRRSGGERREVKKYPPPLPSLNQNGQPTVFLKSVRKDGRLELTDVRIERPEILRASRQDGRLRLHLVRDEEEEEVELEQEENIQESRIVEEEEERGDEEWGFLEGFRRCHEEHDYNNHSNHHHNLHVWSQQCVPTR